MGSEGRQQGRQRELRAEVMTPQTEAMVVKWNNGGGEVPHDVLLQKHASEKLAGTAF